MWSVEVQLSQDKIKGNWSYLIFVWGPLKGYGGPRERDMKRTTEHDGGLGTFVYTKDSCSLLNIPLENVAVFFIV